MTGYVFCNQHGEVKGTMWEGALVCPYHQRISHSEDGEVHFMYDEFNQDGEEW